MLAARKDSPRPKMREFRLREMPNGGWVLCQIPEDERLIAQDVGAYSSAKDLLDALWLDLSVQGSGQ